MPLAVEAISACKVAIATVNWNHPHASTKISRPTCWACCLTLD